MLYAARYYGQTSKEVAVNRRRKVLQRSLAMETLMRREVGKVVEDHRTKTAIYDGIIYMMHTKGDDGGVVPLLYRQI